MYTAMHPVMLAAHVIDLIKLEMNFRNLLTFGTLQTVVYQLFHSREILVPGAAIQHISPLTRQCLCVHA